ncbi:hypothetical protein ACQ4PT_019134 [Festuca glaucescens]
MANTPSPSEALQNTATADASSATAGRPQETKIPEIDRLQEQLDLQEEDFDDVIVDDVEDVTLESTRWLAIMRVYIGKSFSQSALYSQMRSAWNLAQDVRFRKLGANMFIAQVFCLADWKRVTEQGPWLFRQHAVLIEPYDGFSKAESIVLEYMPIWMQIHELPEGYRKTNIIEKLAKKAGKIMEVQFEGPSIYGDYLRIRVRHDVREPLLRFVSIVRHGERVLFLCKYEKLARFCEVCGLLGHEYEECGTGIHEAKDRKFGSWMYADPPPNRGRSEPDPGRGFGGRFQGRHPGAGRGQRGGRGFASTTAEEDEDLRDTGIRSINPQDTNMVDRDKGARKRLALEDKGLDDLNKIHQGTLALVNQNENHASAVAETLVGDADSLDIHDNKKARKNAEAEKKLAGVTSRNRYHEDFSDSAEIRTYRF